MARVALDMVPSAPHRMCAQLHIYTDGGVTVLPYLGGKENREPAVCGWAVVVIGQMPDKSH
eukprot:7780471-Alexandrium_andersonii.AAC.1